MSPHIYLFNAAVMFGGGAYMLVQHEWFVAGCCYVACIASLTLWVREA